MLLTPVSANKLQTVGTFLVADYLPKKQIVIWGIPLNPIFHNFVIYSCIELFIYKLKLGYSCRPSQVPTTN